MARNSIPCFSLLAFLSALCLSAVFSVSIHAEEATVAEAVKAVEKQPKLQPDTDWEGETDSHGEGEIAVAGGSSKQQAEFAKIAALKVGSLQPHSANLRLTKTHLCLGTPFLKGRAVYLDAKAGQVSVTPLGE